jgi:hypothetical protein
MKIEEIHIGPITTPDLPEAWRMMHDFANSAFPRAGAAFSDVHIASRRSWRAMTRRWRRAHVRWTSSRQGLYPSGPCVPAVSHAFAAFERGDLSAAIDALEPIAGELERISGSRAQARPGGVYAVEGLSQRGPPGRCAPDAERAGSRLLAHSRCRIDGRVLIDETTVTRIDLATRGPRFQKA